ncbi:MULTISPECIES: AraC family transcriptional regulator [unclassified Pseudodesulfovibrio]|uniref:helix-turn-helix transcriptional regulator n=1 Tax=unclassified Pseudodesulfovibrio TaxID=2661612 RepID=UPI000FEBAF51|nr:MULTISPECIES: AraC family transcriptional regulator [unclassified Pseudodesulfovibrio]MCJ2163398.1 AraC family transcriptional regulator [Pseudodesulfovibrio sp. S3-i]RWU06634.1 AraC family transcriptional regulator [Pseudodesulfovibrio sp. S3]
MRMKVTSLTHEETGIAAENDRAFLSADLSAPVTAIELRPDMAVCFWECYTREKQAFRVAFDCPVLRLSFTLEGEGLSQADDQEDFARHRGIIEIRYFPGTSGTMTLGAGQQHTWLDIILKPSFLALAVPDELGQLPGAMRRIMKQGTSTVPCDSRKMTPDQFVAATQLAHCPYTHAARTIYLKSKALELLSHVLAEQSPASCRTRLSTYEVECLQKARSLLIADLESPPSLEKLARSVGLNQTKLKKGFKALFGQTVYGYFRTYRVELARQLLLEGTATISEVASTVGYTNISHFSAAFKERHGVTPSRYRKDNLFITNPARPTHTPVPSGI